MENIENMDELDDFKNIEESGMDLEKIELSNVFNIKIGGFGDSKKLRTYFGSATVNELYEDISLYETLTKDKSWPVSQIIQREVDKIRVSGISKSYILGKGRDVKYFPPIIVAILPKDSEGKIALELNFNPDNSEKTKEIIYANSVYNTTPKIKKYIIKAKNISLLDGLYVLEVSKVFDTRLLAWDKIKYYAIVIDGQHRIEALFKSRDDNPSVGEYLQDIVFLDFSPLIKSIPKHTPVEVVRRVFVDINTNAQRVGFVRQVLMDDKDLASLCVQSLVDSTYKDGSSKDENSFIKSQIVDWYGEKLKHTLPHLTGVLSLYQIIDDFLIKDSLSSFRDLRSPKKVRNWVARVNNLFMIDHALKNDSRFQDLDITKLNQSLEDYNLKINQNKEYLDEMDDEFKESELFDFDFRILDVARAKFEDIYLRPLIKCFNEIRPHQRTIDIIQSEGGFDNNDILVSALISSRKKIAHSREYKDALSSLRRKIENELHSNYFLLLTVLGQKVIFNNLFQRILAEVDPEFNESKCFDITDKYIADLNNLFDFIENKKVSLFTKKDDVVINSIPNELTDLGTIASSFWEGVVYENNNIIYNTQGIRTLSYILSEFVRLNEDRINGVSSSIDLIKAPYIKSRINRVLNRRFDFSDDQVINFTNQIIKLKSDFINSYFN